MVLDLERAKNSCHSRRKNNVTLNFLAGALSLGN